MKKFNTPNKQRAKQASTFTLMTNGTKLTGLLDDKEARQDRDTKDLMVSKNVDGKQMIKLSPDVSFLPYGHWKEYPCKRNSDRLFHISTGFDPSNICITSTSGADFFSFKCTGVTGVKALFRDNEMNDKSILSGTVRRPNNGDRTHVEDILILQKVDGDPKEEILQDISFRSPWPCCYLEHNSGTSSGQTSIIEDTLFTLENSLGLDLSLVRVSQEKKMNMEIESHDVIKLMLQFLRENNLTSSLHALQTETGISLNTVPNVDAFTADIRDGKWDAVLNQVSSLVLSQEKLCLLYEQVVIELLEAREIDLVKEMLRTVEPLCIMKAEQPARFARLEQLTHRPVFVASDAYELGTNKEKRRREIASQLTSELTVVPPSRLMALIGQALRFQQAQGTLPSDAPFDLFKGSRRKARKDNEEKIPKKQAGSIKFSTESHPETVVFSPDGSGLVTGSVDGFIEVWDADQCRLRKDLDYQAKDELMMHEEAVLCATFNRDGELLATGSQEGKVKVWKISTGACLRKFNKAHSVGVTSLCFTKDSTQILTGSFDQLARIHGLKSGKTLKEFRGHTSYVNCAIFTKDGSNTLTGSSDGSVRLWDSKTTESLLEFRPGLSTNIMSVSRDIAVHTLRIMPNNSDHLLVCMKCPQALIMTVQGQVVKSFSSGKQSGGDFLCATTSPQGKWIYCVGEDGILYTFDGQTGQLENILHVSEKEVIGICHHPHRNLITTIDDSGELRTWKP